MPARVAQTTTGRLLMMALMTTGPALLLLACEREVVTAAPAARPVRIITVEKSKAGTPLSFTGRVEAEDEVALAFRISGRLLESNGRVGDRVEAGQLVARLESQNELNTLRQAEAGLTAAQGQLTQARNQQPIVWSNRTACCFGLLRSPDADNRTGRPTRSHSADIKCPIWPTCAHSRPLPHPFTTHDLSSHARPASLVFVSSPL
jgi:hypothetical protein